MKLVTDPPPELEPVILQVVVPPEKVQFPAPEEKLKTSGPGLLLTVDTTGGVQLAPSVHVVPFHVRDGLVRPELFSVPESKSVSMPPDGLEKARVNPLNVDGFTKFNKV